MAVLIEGATPEELEALSAQELRELVFIGRPIVFKAGTASILGEFSERGSTLIVELAHIDDGGEGALTTLAAVVQRIAQRQGFQQVDWYVYATNCAQPNLKLRRVLERRGFQVAVVDGKGECYFRSVAV